MVGNKNKNGWNAEFAVNIFFYSLFLFGNAAAQMDAHMECNSPKEGCSWPKRIRDYSVF